MRDSVDGALGTAGTERVLKCIPAKLSHAELTIGGCAEFPELIAR